MGREAAVQFMLMICGDETAAEHADDGCGGWSEKMVERGVLRGGGGLGPPSEGTTVRVREGQVLLGDGPFAETKEQIGGFCIIDCADLAEAMQIAAEHPAATYGTIEIRPLRLPPENFSG